MGHIIMAFPHIVENTVTQDPVDKFHDFDKNYSYLVSSKMYYIGCFIINLVICEAVGYVGTNKIQNIQKKNVSITNY